MRSGPRIGDAHRTRRGAPRLSGPAAWAAVAGLLIVLAPRLSLAQAAVPPPQPATIDTTLEAGEADAQKPVERGLAKYNHWDLGFTTFRIGYGFLVDFATYSQDDIAKRQVEA